MINLIPLGLASAMALIDALVFSWLKSYSIGTISWNSILPIGMVIYSLQPLLFLKSLQYETMTVMNIMWDITSDIFVTILGLFYFKEKLSTLKKVGVTFAFIAIVLLSYDSMNGSK